MGVYSKVVLAAFLGILAEPALAKRTLIVSDPPGAEVSVEGRVLGVTPLETDRKTIMPGWASDGRITQVSISVALPMYRTYSVTVSEWSIPKKIEAVLVQDGESLHFESFLDAVEGLASSTEEALAPPVVLVSEDLDRDSERLQQDGYAVVGYIGTSAPTLPIEFIREKGESLAAHLVLIKSSDAGVQTELRAVKSTTSGGAVSTFGSSSGRATVSAFGSGPFGQGTVTGFGAGSGTSTSVTFVPSRSTTTWIPYERRQYSTQGTVWRKRKSNPVGLVLDAVPPALRAELQRNTGAFVSSVKEGSPAFLSDLLVGDVVIELNGRPVRQPSELDAFIEEFGTEGSVELVVLRKGVATSLTLFLR